MQEYCLFLAARTNLSVILGSCFYIKNVYSGQVDKQWRQNSEHAVWTSLGMSCLKSGFEQTVVQVEQDGNSDLEVFHNGSPQRFSKVTLNSARRSSHPSVRREKRLSRLRQRPCGKPLRPKKHRRNAEDLCIFLSYLYHTHRDTYIYIYILRGSALCSRPRGQKCFLHYRNVVSSCCHPKAKQRPIQIIVLSWPGRNSDGVESVEGFHHDLFSSRSLRE